MDTEEKRSRFGEIDHPRLPLPIMWSRRQEIRRTSFYASVLARALRRSVSRFTVQRSGGSIDYDYALLMESEQGLYSAARLCSITDYPDIRTSACVLSVCVCVCVLCQCPNWSCSYAIHLAGSVQWKAVTNSGGSRYHEKGGPIMSGAKESVADKKR